MSFFQINHGSENLGGCDISDHAITRIYAIQNSGAQYCIKGGNDNYLY